MFGNKWKYKRGHVSESQWVFGMVEQGTGWILVFCVPDRQRETLVTRLVREFIEPGTNHFWQVLAILQPKWCRLHPPDGQPFGKLCWHLYWSTQQHHRGTQGVKLKGSQRQWMGPWKPNYQVTLMSSTGVNFIQRQTRETNSITCCPTYQRWFHWTKFTWFKSK